MTEYWFHSSERHCPHQVGSPPAPHLSLVLQKDLEKAHEDHRRVVAQKEHLEEEKYSVLQQLNDTNERDKKNLQLIRELEQEIRLNVNRNLQAGLISEGSETATATFADRPAISDQAASQVDTTESSPAVYQHETASSPLIQTSERDPGCLSMVSFSISVSNCLREAFVLVS